MAAELRSYRARLLSRMLYGVGDCTNDSGATTFLLYGDGVLACDVSARDSAEEAGEAA
jgi:hypothetical protein